MVYRKWKVMAPDQTRFGQRLSINGFSKALIGFPAHEIFKLEIAVSIVISCVLAENLYLVASSSPSNQSAPIVRGGRFTPIITAISVQRQFMCCGNGLSSL
jgi:hypothetical protein